MSKQKQYPPVVVVDENDNETGFEMLSTVWEQGIYHRIVSVFINDFDGNMLLQLRGPNVKVFPNCWDQAAGGHVDKGNTYEQTALKETMEELGIEVGGLEFTELGTHRTNAQENGHLVNQFERAYLVKMSRDTVLKPQDDEVSKLQWFTPAELKSQKDQDPKKFTPGLLFCLKKYFSL
jgi:isopentenyldiphosphate isomerase